MELESLFIKNFVKKKESGFSLLELSVAIGIAAVLAAGGLIASTAFLNSSKDNADKYIVNAERSITEAEIASNALVSSPLAPVLNPVSTITTSSASISWSPAETATSYEIYLEGILIDTVDKDTLSYIFENLDDNKYYEYNIVAVNGGGSSDAATGGFTTVRLIIAPSAPTSLTSSNITIDSATISWTAPSSGTEVDEYIIFLNNIEVDRVDGNTLTYTFTDLNDDTTYNYSIRAANSAGSTLSAIGSFKTVKLIIAPSAPTGLTLSNTTATATGVNSTTLSWTAPTVGTAVDNYEIYVNGALNKTVTGATLSTSITGLTVETNYTFMVKAINEAGSASASTTLRIAAVQATGGTVTTITQNGMQYRVHRFTAGSTFTITSAPSGARVEYLIVGGGGSGGRGDNGQGGGGGGGAGGVRTGNAAVSVQGYGVVVGAGGIASTCDCAETTQTAGHNSSALGITAIGGGRGEGHNSQGRGDKGLTGGGQATNQGGSGGGAFRWYAPGLGTAGQGNAGGAGGTTDTIAGGGGGGAGGAGVANTTNSTVGRNGGAAIMSSITGLNVWYAGGGGSGGQATSGGLGGGTSTTAQKGGAGNGGSNGAGGAGVANTGGGGGGGTGGLGGSGTNGGNGGSGVIVIRYPIGPAA